MREAEAYGEAILELIERAIEGNLTREEFEQLLRRKVYSSLEEAFRAGAKIPQNSMMFPEERLKLEQALTDHEESIIRMTNELYTAIELQRASGQS